MNRRRAPGERRSAAPRRAPGMQSLAARSASHRRTPRGLRDRAGSCEVHSHNIFKIATLNQYVAAQGTQISNQQKLSVIYRITDTAVDQWPSKRRVLTAP